jgi:hypothetical protein
MGHMFCAERTTGLEIILDALDGTARCVGHVESYFGPFGDYVSVDPFGDSVSVHARLVHHLRQTYHRLRNDFDAPNSNS